MTGGGGGTNDSSIYPLFVEQALALEPRYLTMVIPSRWMAGGRGLDEFRTNMLGDRRIRSMVDYPTRPGLPRRGPEERASLLPVGRVHDGDCAVTLIRDVRWSGRRSASSTSSTCSYETSERRRPLEKVLAIRGKL